MDTNLGTGEVINKEGVLIGYLQRFAFYFKTRVAMINNSKDINIPIVYEGQMPFDNKTKVLSKTSIVLIHCSYY